MNTKYSKQKDIEALIALKDTLGHEPTAKEIDACPDIASSRQIQRNWGGLGALREAAGLTVKDHTKGQIRSKTAALSHKKANKYEKDIYQRIYDKYHDHSGQTTYVIREFAYQQYVKDGDWYKNIKCDVAIDDREKRHITMIDFFYAKDKHSLTGCLNVKRSKLKKYPPQLFGCTYEVIFVSVNPQIPDSDLVYYKEHGDFTYLTHGEFKRRFLDTP